MPKDNQNPSSKGGGDEELQNLLANHESHQERPPKSVLELPERSRLESSEVVGGETSIAVIAAPEVSTASTPVKEGGGGTSPEDAPLGPERSTLK